ncbi:hypothetical protein BDY24DRAFT_374767 [Mrakia frigida]|uniref:protein-lysine N-methyltransferase n=1 Tax=Mrakia frigida TaxID=29902 RepID=UPI003FCBFB69
MVEDSDPEWTALVEWLQTEHGMGEISVKTKRFPGAGRGLVVSRPIPYNIFHPPPNLLMIPSSALLNANTLRPHYPPPFAPISTRKHHHHSLHSSKRKHSSKSTPPTPTPSPPAEPSSPHFPLTSTQFVTLHLALHNPNSSTPKHPSLPSDPWATYLACCPKDFDHHPLTWIVDVDEGGGDEKTRRRREALVELADCLPRTTKILPNLAPLPTHPYPLLTLSNLLWAWLNYNTRCLSYPLHLAPSSGLNDHTMSPVVDLANHSVRSTPTPYLFPTDVSSSKSTHYAWPAPEGRKMEEGEEIFLQYGAHPEGFLMAEYGFASGSWEGKDGEGRNEWDEVGLDWEVEKLFEGLGEVEGSRKRDILEKEGYWGNYTLHSHPLPAHPSHRLLPALRLYHTSLSPSSTPTTSSSSTQTQRSGSLAQWKDTLQGYESCVSDQNELLTRQTLVSLCEGVEHDVVAGFERLDRLQTGSASLWDEGDERDGWSDKCESVKVLWKGMRRISEEVRESCESGVEF